MDYKAKIEFPEKFPPGETFINHEQLQSILKFTRSSLVNAVQMGRIKKSSNGKFKRVEAIRSYLLSTSPQKVPKARLKVFQKLCRDYGVSTISIKKINTIEKAKLDEILVRTELTKTREQILKVQKENKMKALIPRETLEFCMSDLSTRLASSMTQLKKIIINKASIAMGLDPDQRKILKSLLDENIVDVMGLIPSTAKSQSLSLRKFLKKNN